MNPHKKLLVLIFAVMAPLLSFIFLSLFSYYLLFITSYQGDTAPFEVKSGDTFAKVNTRLKKRNLIKSTRLFHQYARFTSQMNCLKEGIYPIQAGMNATDILKTLCSGQGITISVTIPEGKNLYEIARLLEEKKLASYEEFKKLSFDQDFLASLGIHHFSLEGLLYPETYRFSPKVSTKDIIKTMVSEFNQKMKEQLSVKTQEKLNFYQVLTLASIVEKETGHRDERRRIAGVFLNRLKKRMRLQSDPTTIYSIFENFDGNIKKKHLLEKTSHNTYQMYGLPPGPICNPGIESIKAVLDPEHHDYLYFVASNDGRHIFTTNYKDHRQMVNQYQKRKKKKN